MEYPLLNLNLHVVHSGSGYHIHLVQVLTIPGLGMVYLLVALGVLIALYFLNLLLGALVFLPGTANQYVDAVWTASRSYHPAQCGLSFNSHHI